MNFYQRFDLMLKSLEANTNVKIIELALNPSASDDEIEEAKKLANGFLPGGVEDFFREINGINLEWEHNVESIKKYNDSDKGFIKILPILEIFRDWKGITWFDDLEEGDEYRLVKPVDFFVPEACTAFCQEKDQIPRNTVYYHYCGEYLEDTKYTFEEYLDRLLVSRGYFYWVQTLCPKLQRSAEVADFRKNMPLIFEDYNDDLFYPKI